jgi:hypothetical protein
LQSSNKDVSVPAISLSAFKAMAGKGGRDCESKMSGLAAVASTGVVAEVMVAKVVVPVGMAFSCPVPSAIRV